MTSQAPRSLPLVALVIVVAVLGVNARILAGGETWSDLRYHTEVAPPRLAAADAVQHGELPAWWEGTALGVPLASEPSHGAMYPPTWGASSPRALDWLALLHLVWLGLGVAMWARSASPRTRTAAASEPAAVAAAILVVTTGLYASAAVRGALPALAHLPWVGLFASRLADAGDRRKQTHAAIGLAVVLGLVGLAGSLAVLVDALVLAVALGARRSIVPLANPSAVAAREGALASSASRDENDASPEDREASSDSDREDGANPRTASPTSSRDEASSASSAATGARSETSSAKPTRRALHVPMIAVAIAIGLAIAAAQWIPAIAYLAGDHAGGTVTGMPLARLLELVVPGSFGSGDPERAVTALAGDTAWAPSLFVGAPLLALAAVRTPHVRLAIPLGLFALLALVVGRGGWPHWLGAPELHVAALVAVLAVNAAAGFDALVDGKRRAFVALAAGGACTVIALVALAVLRARHPSAQHAIDRALVDGGLGVACIAGALAIARRFRPINAATAWNTRVSFLLALLVLPTAGATPSTAPATSRAILDEPPTWALLAAHVPEPRRLYRPTHMFDAVRADVDRPAVSVPRSPTAMADLGEPVETLTDAIATLAGTSGARWGIGAARSEDPARPAVHDRVWAAAAREGGALLDRFGIALAILPESLIVPRKLTALSQRGRWAFVELPVAPAASVLRGWWYAIDPDDALYLMFPAGGGMGFLRGTTVLTGRGQARGDRGPPLPCTIEQWSYGAIDLSCTTDLDGFAVVSSAAEPGWTATLDGADVPWQPADVLRRAVPVTPGNHAISWRYRAPGLWLGLAICASGLVILLVLALQSRSQAVTA